MRKEMSMANNSQSKMMHDVWDYSSDNIAGLVVNYGISNTWRGQGISKQQMIIRPAETFNSVVIGKDVAVIFKVWFPKSFKIVLSISSQLLCESGVSLQKMALIWYVFCAKIFFGIYIFVQIQIQNHWNWIPTGPNIYRCLIAPGK